eukprot:CAMPEP_0119131278 /NCGR_PEP_ID=MMETSP1310-20130426/9907_1 /TAXON_ID=464262 /ORGANISM="Genus nov. species nov., Strain RCC2339" /LENGTH=32 /DNA_ID= /DNA_START= /DNA_END= /DNA_ORIENTATION=
MPPRSTCRLHGHRIPSSPPGGGLGESPGRAPP